MLHVLIRNTIHGLMLPLILATALKPTTASEMLQTFFENSPLKPAKAATPASPGMVYQSAGALWQIMANGQAQQILARDHVTLSADGKRAFFSQDADLWMADLSNGSETNLTNTPDCDEQSLKSWTAKPNTLIFNSRSFDNFGPSEGALSMINLDGNGYRVLDIGESSALPAPAPDGRSIAYDVGLKPKIYRLASGPENVDLRRMLPQLPADYKAASPAWSPNGQKLAWMVGATVAGKFQTRVALVDMTRRTAQLLHPFEARGRGGWVEAPVFSPNGEWLALKVPSINGTELYAIRADGKLEKRLLAAQLPRQSNPTLTWGNDSRMLGVSFAAPDGAKNYLVTIADASAMAIDLPTDARIIAWLQ